MALDSPNPLRESSAISGSHSSSSSKTVTEEDIWTRGVEPRFQGCLDSGIKSEGSSHPCGDRVSMFMRLDADIIADMKHITDGCCLTKAIADRLCEICIGRPASFIGTLASIDVVRLNYARGRRDCVELPFRVLKALYGQAQLEKEARP